MPSDALPAGAPTPTDETANRLAELEQLLRDMFGVEDELAKAEARVAELETELAGLRSRQTRDEDGQRKLRRIIANLPNVEGPPAFPRPKVYLDSGGEPGADDTDEMPAEWRCVEGVLQAREFDGTRMDLKFGTPTPAGTNEEWLLYLDESFQHSAAAARLALADPMTPAEAKIDDAAVIDALIDALIAQSPSTPQDEGSSQ